MIKLALFGYPVRHSLSPLIHAAAFHHSELIGSYEALLVEPGLLPHMFKSCSYAGYRGLNITIPHKVNVGTLCARVDEIARVTGAVNTVIFDEAGSSLGTNTDVDGFLTSLAVESGFDLANKKALVVGAGGAARAVVVALISGDAASVTVTNRSIDSAQLLARQLSVPFCPYTKADLARLKVDIVINATACGMSVLRRSAEWRECREFVDVLPLSAWSQPFVYDLVYRPRLTPFLESAQDQGCPTQGGLAMLACQGAHSFELWTGISSDDLLKPMMDALQAKL